MDNHVFASSDTAKKSLPAKEGQELHRESTTDGTCPMSGVVTVRPLRRDEVIVAHRMLASEWVSLASLGFHYALYDAYPGGWLCATIDDSIVGITFFAKFPNGSGCAGYFFVKKEYRKKGVGCHLRDTLASHFQGANLGISGVDDLVDSYSRSGYGVRSFGIRLIGGKVNVAAAVERLAELRQQSPLTTSNGDAITLSEVRVPSEELLRYDAEINLARRDAFVTLFTALPESYTLAAIRQDGTIAGYGSIYRGDPSYICAPLYADDEHVAELILLSFVERLKPGDSLIWRTHDTNTAAARLVELLGQQQVLHLFRLFTRYDVPVPLHKVYSLASGNASFA